MRTLSAHLEDEESLVGEVDPAVFEEGGNLGVVARPLVDRVFGLVVLVRGPGDNQLRVGNALERVRSRLAVARREGATVSADYRWSWDGAVDRCVRDR